MTGGSAREEALARTPSDSTASPAPAAAPHGQRLPPCVAPSHRPPCRPLPTPAWTSRTSWTSTSSGRRLADAAPGPCSGADSRPLVPSLAAGAAACRHPPHADARTQEGGLADAGGGARRGWEGWSPAARQCEGSEGSAWGSGGPGAPVSPAVRRDAAAWRLRFLGVVPGPPRGRDSGAPLPHPACGGRGQEGAPSSPGESGGTRSRGLLCRPCSSGPLTLSPMGAGQLWSLGDSKKEGPGAGRADSSLGWACAHPPRGTRPPPSSQGAAGSLHAPGGPGGPPAPQQLRSCP